MRSHLSPFPYKFSNCGKIRKQASKGGVEMGLGCKGREGGKERKASKQTFHSEHSLLIFSAGGAKTVERSQEDTAIRAATPSPRSAFLHCPCGFSDGRRRRYPAYFLSHAFTCLYIRGRKGNAEAWGKYAKTQ